MNSCPRVKKGTDCMQPGMAKARKMRVHVYPEPCNMRQADIADIAKRLIGTPEARNGWGRAALLIAEGVGSTLRTLRPRNLK